MLTKCFKKHQPFSASNMFAMLKSIDPKRTSAISVYLSEVLHRLDSRPAVKKSYYVKVALLNVVKIETTAWNGKHTVRSAGLGAVCNRKWNDSLPFTFRNSSELTQ